MEAVGPRGVHGSPQRVVQPLSAVLPITLTLLPCLSTAALPHHLASTPYSELCPARLPYPVPPFSCPSVASGPHTLTPPHYLATHSRHGLHPFYGLNYLARTPSFPPTQLLLTSAASTPDLSNPQKLQ
ncbi:hypothetical protein E2C01_020880 [Portunus trituberculatus]|uniref:Uncharacterized protein n=1 Tax=Portunus trituberculatus TaxID=210409 RepID=A0A5B7E134_PORTR|nr:hypothetical protein [Portunus trituberculatus]